MGGGVSVQNKGQFYAQDFLPVGASPVVNNSAWHLLTGVVDNVAGTTSMYVDGVLVSSGGLSPLVQSSASFLVGGVAVSGSPRSYFTGLIDDVRIYDNALSAAEVSALYGAPVPEPATWAMLAVGLTLLTVGRRRRHG